MIFLIKATAKLLQANFQTGLVLLTFSIGYLTQMERQMGLCRLFSARGPAYVNLHPGVSVQVTQVLSLVIFHVSPLANLKKAVTYKSIRLSLTVLSDTRYKLHSSSVGLSTLIAYLETLQ